MREGHFCKHLNNRGVPWAWVDCICNPNMISEVMGEEE